MSRSSDYQGEMRSTHELDDATAEAVLRGDSVPAGFEPLAEAVEAIRRVGGQQVEPSPELVERMSRGDFNGVPVPSGVPDGRRRSRAASMGWKMKAAAGSIVAIVGFSGAAAAGALPDTLEERVRTLIETVTPIDFADSTGSGITDGEEAEPAPGKQAPGQQLGRSSGHGYSDPGGRDGAPIPPAVPDVPDAKPEPPGFENRPEPPGDPKTRPNPPGADNRPETPGERENRPDTPGESRPETPGEPETKPESSAERSESRHDSGNRSEVRESSPGVSNGQDDNSGNLGGNPGTSEDRGKRGEG